MLHFKMKLLLTYIFCTVNYAFSQKITIFPTNTKFVSSIELNNLKSALRSSFFTKEDEVNNLIDISDVTDLNSEAFDSDIMVVPELINTQDSSIDLNSAACSKNTKSVVDFLDSNNKNKIKNFVEKGKKIIIVGSNRFFKNNDIKFINDIFGFNLAHAKSGIECENGNFNIPEPLNNFNVNSGFKATSAVYCLDSRSLPKSSCQVYVKDLDKEETIAFHVKVGKGYLIYIGFDWFTDNKNWYKIFRSYIGRSLNNLDEMKCQLPNFPVNKNPCSGFLTSIPSFA